jgi:hypothetical protein
MLTNGKCLLFWAIANKKPIIFKHCFGQCSSKIYSMPQSLVKGRNPQVPFTWDINPTIGANGGKY